ncbi:hypothetical protein ACH4D5_08565 [Streptomyces sp. NPDC018029]|uniref:hypothetical protein n=1 Tax=Streptomyces sp. NPDC018029 TaxID=3365032 RepID=UPI00378DC93F
MDTPTEHPSLLPITHATLAADPRLLAAVREVGARHGFDYTDDAATAALLAERGKAVRGAGRSAPGWLGLLAILAGVCWPFVASEAAALAEQPRAAVLLGPAVLLLGVGGWLWVLVWRRWKRELRHPLLTGYREVIGLAQAHGAPVTHVPDWLVGRSEGRGGEGAAPIPSYAEVTPLAEVAPLPEGEAAPTPPPAPTAAAAAAAAAAATNCAIPPKPSTVTAYEATADQGGWHDEAGWILLFAGGAGVAWGYTQDAPVGYLAVLLIPLAIVTWLAGSRQGKEKQELRDAAVAYVRALAAAQAAGARAPELSPVLRKLLAEESAGAGERPGGTDETPAPGRAAE